MLPIAQSFFRFKYYFFLISGNLLTLSGTKESMAPTMLQVYDAIADAKPAIGGFIKQEVKRRRKDFVCPTCKEDQMSDIAFQAHLKIHPLECLTCGKCFYKRANLSLHIKTHLGIKNFKWVGIDLWFADIYSDRNIIVGQC